MGDYVSTSLGRLNYALLRAYDPNAIYIKRDLVAYQNGTYAVLKDGITGVTPVSDGQNYLMFAGPGIAGTSNAVWFAGTEVAGRGSGIAVSVIGSKAGDMYLNNDTSDIYLATDADTWDWKMNLLAGVDMKAEDVSTTEPGVSVEAALKARPKAVLSDIVTTVNMVDLQAFIDSLPKILLAGVTINVNPGTAIGPIVISGFSGWGPLAINGADALASTHNVPSFAINYCTNSRISITGFNVTTTAVGMNFINNSSTIYIIACRIIAGTSSIGGNRGIAALYSVSCLLIGCEISNKEWAALSLQASRVIAEGLSGYGNAGVYLAQAGSILQVAVSGSIAGDTMYVKTGGAFIVNADGSLV